MAQVHRFRDNVAAWLGTGETVYMSPQEAKRLAKALNKVAKSCQTENFSESTCGTISVVIKKEI
jgi:hypothetical protein